MSLRPIDLQVMLTQMSSVAKRELKDKDKVKEQKVQYEQNNEQKRENIIVEVDQVEVANNITGKVESLQRDKKKKRENPAPEDKTTKKNPFESELKGKFLDIKE